MNNHSWYSWNIILCWVFNISKVFSVFLSPRSSLFLKAVLLQVSAVPHTILLIHTAPAILAFMLLLRNVQHTPFSWLFHFLFPLSRTLLYFIKFSAQIYGLIQEAFPHHFKQYTSPPLSNLDLLYFYLKALSQPDISICILYVSLH